ncbi:MAG: hypothetical protein OEZ02_04050 [Anaerolineae bacterium]|nr:hypothetical protein [Anaerolineae bacterium]
MAKENKKESKDAREEALWMGVWVFIMLAVMTFGEFLIAKIAVLWSSLLIYVALGKAFYVVKDYMHIGRLFAGDEEVH